MRGETRIKGNGKIVPRAISNGAGTTWGPLLTRKGESAAGGTAARTPAERPPGGAAAQGRAGPEIVRRGRTWERVSRPSAVVPARFIACAAAPHHHHAAAHTSGRKYAEGGDGGEVKRVGEGATAVGRRPGR